MFAGRWRRGFRAGLVVCGELFRRERPVVAGVTVSATLAEGLAVAMDLAVVVDAFAALLAGDTGGFVPGHLARVNGNGDPLFAEEIRVGHLAVGEHLLLVLVFDLGVE